MPQVDEDPDDPVSVKRIQPFQGSLEALPNDAPQIAQAINIKAIDLKVWLETLDHADLAAVDALVEKYSKSLGTGQHTRCFVSHIREYKALDAMGMQKFSHLEIEFSHLRKKISYLKIKIFYILKAVLKN